MTGDRDLNIKIREISKKIFILSAILCILAGLLKIVTYAETPNKVKVAFFTDKSYFTSESEDGKKTGYVYDYYQMISNYTGWTYDYVYGTYDELYVKFLNGEIDIFPAVLKNEATENQMLFTEHPMGNMICRLYTLNGNTEISHSNLETLGGITIGVTSDNYLNSYFEEVLKSENIKFTFVKFDEYSDMIEHFEDGTVDTIIDTEITASNRWRAVEIIGSYDYYLAVSPERTDLYEEIHDVLDIVYDRIPNYNNLKYYEYYSNEGINRTATEGEREWAKSNKEFTVGLLDNTSNNQNKFIRTVIARMLYELGLSTITTEYIEYSNYDDLVDALNNNEIDAAYPLFDDISMAEENGYSIVETLEETPMDIVTARDLKKDEIKTILVSDVMQYYYCASNYPDIKVTFLDSAKKCLDKVTVGEADATVIPCHLTGEGADIADEYSYLIFKDINPMGCAFVVNKENTELYSIMKHGISLLDINYINHISVGASYKNTNYGFNDLIDDYYWLINIIIIVIAVLILIVTYLIGLRRRNIKKHKEATIYQCALYSQAVGYFQCNLSKDVMMSPYMKIIDGEPVDIVDYIPFTTGALFSSLMDYLASHNVVSNSNAFREFMNPDKLIECYNNGDFKPEFSCWISVPHNGNKVFQRYAYFLSQDNSKDVIATCIVYDLSEHEGELEKQRVKAESANIAKSTFLFNITHDVRTPMNAIIGYANMAEKNIGNTEKLQDCIAKIQVSSQQLLILLDDALDMSRVESGKVIINEESINFIDHIERAKKVITANAEMLGIDVKFQIGKLKNYEIYVDSMHLNKILSNVVDNAFKYSKPNGTVKIAISQLESDNNDFARYTFVIEDDGIGMTPEFLAHIYEMFAREQSSTISGIQGTGVGMAITKKLVDLMNGDISIESEKGKGTKVTLEFNFRINKAVEVQEEVEEPTEEVSFEGKRILLVEDIELNREIAKEILEEEGIIVEEAVDGSIAVDMVSKSEPGYYSLIFMDIQMPVMDGYEATRQIRKLENKELAQIPIVAMTANVLDEDIQNSLEAGMDAHLAKPIDIMAMFSTMQKYIK